MASHFLREMRFLTTPARNGTAFYAKCLSLWLYQVLGFTNFTEDVSGEAGNETYDPTDSSYGYEKTGSNGVLSSSSFNFVDATAGSFVAGDAGKWILIIDASNPENSGWYRISAYVDANTVTIDFRSAASEYPTAASSLTWYLMAEDFETPIVNGSYFRQRTPYVDTSSTSANHTFTAATQTIARASGSFITDGFVAGDSIVVAGTVSNNGTYRVKSVSALSMVMESGISDESSVASTVDTTSWEIQVKINTTRHIEISLSMDQDWTASGKVLAWRHGSHNDNSDANKQYWYAEGSDTGSHLNLWWQNDDGGTGFTSVGKISPYETSPAHPACELWVLGGSTTNATDGTDHTVPDDVAGTNWTGEVWRNRMMSSRKCHAVSWTYEYSLVGFVYDSASTVNTRTSKNDIGPGRTMVTDQHNQDNEYELMGELQGTEMIRSNLSEGQTIDDAGTKDKIHIRDGWLVPWPGYTIQFVP